jgi:hypothetical protein
MNWNSRQGAGASRVSLAACSGKSASSGKPAGAQDAASDSNQTRGVPTGFAWTTGGPLLAPQSDATETTLGEYESREQLYWPGR